MVGIERSRSEHPFCSDVFASGFEGSLFGVVMRACDRLVDGAHGVREALRNAGTERPS